MSKCQCGMIELGNNALYATPRSRHYADQPCSIQEQHKREYECDRCMDTKFVATFPNPISCPDCTIEGVLGGLFQPSTPTPRVQPTALRYTGATLRPGKPGDAGIDLPAADEVCIPGSGFGVVPIKTRVELPPGYWGWIIQRSSTFWKKQLLVNQAVIDNGYRGELFVAVYNLGEAPYNVEFGERLAQLVLVPLAEMPLHYVPEDEFSEDTDRGTTGFGSTG